MKKSFIFALAAAGMLCSCSSEDAISTDVNNNDSELVPIQLGISNNVVVTRGTGTVGGVVDAEGNVVDGQVNNWMGQYINVYMVNRGTTIAASFNQGEPAMFDNAQMVAPSDKDKGVAKFEDGTIHYYPTVGAYDFWAYRTDGAEGDNEPVVTDETIKIDFTIDGSQDVMAAKTELNSDELDAIGGNANAAYSAFSARKGVQPNLNFEHLLSRLTFQIKGGPNVDESTGVKVAKIAVQSKTQGILTIIPEAGGEQGIVWSADKEELLLKERAKDAKYTDELVELTPTLPSIGEEAPVKLGEALLVAPDTEYDIVVYLTQEVLVNELTGETKERTAEYPATLRTDSKNPFTAGHSYTVTITVHGLQDIEINAVLAPWVEDADSSIEIEPEDNLNLND